MRRYLLAALWPAGIAAILATTVIKARQAGGTAGPGNGGGRSVAGPASAAGSGVAAAAGLGSGLADSVQQGTARTRYPAGLVPGVFRRAAEPVARREWALGLLRLGAISCAGGALSYLRSMPFGDALLAFTAAGLIAFGLFAFVEARYRDLGLVRRQAATDCADAR